MVQDLLIVWFLFAISVYIQAVDQPSSFTINRMFIISFLILALQTPFYFREGKEWAAGWVHRFFQATLLIQYGTAGVCKMVSGNWLIKPIQEALLGNPENLLRELNTDPIYLLNIVDPTTVWGQSQGHYKNIISAWAIHHLPLPIWWCLAISTLIFEFGAPFFFIWKRTRIPVVIFGVLFHLGIAILMKDLIFTFLRISIYNNIQECKRFIHV